MVPQTTAARNAHDLKVNVYRNYQEYIRTAQVISKLEGELRTVETLLGDHRVGLHGAQVTTCFLARVFVAGL